MQFCYVFEFYGDPNYYRGVIAKSEDEARTIAMSRGHRIKRLAKIETVIN